MMQAVATAVGSSLTVIKEVVRPMSKQARWQARKYLIGRGRSIYRMRGLRRNAGEKKSVEEKGKQARMSITRPARGARLGA